MYVCQRCGHSYDQYHQYTCAASGTSQLLQSLQSPPDTLTGVTMSYSGTKPLVVSGSTVIECDTLDAAQTKAEELAHSTNATVYIFKPVKKVAPKRDVVTTDIP